MQIDIFQRRDAAGKSFSQIVMSALERLFRLIHIHENTDFPTPTPPLKGEGHTEFWPFSLPLVGRAGGGVKKSALDQH